MTTGIVEGDRLLSRLDPVIEEARGALKRLQRPEGEWLFELEPDATISAEYILLRHFLGNLDEAYCHEVEPRIANYLRAIQGEEGWPLYHGGEAELSASVKAYLALKLAGDPIEAPHMQRARELILAQGGAARANVFTRITLALYGAVPWRAVPVMPIEIMLLPQWFPFHLSKVSYWSRTVIVPLLLLMELKPRAANPRGATIEELFLEPPERSLYPLNPTGTAIGAFFAGVDHLLRRVAKLRPPQQKERAMAAAIAFCNDRLNGEDGLGGIFPAMANLVMAFHALGYPPEHDNVATARRSIEKLLVRRGKDQIYCQPCLSPVWDTALASLALIEAGEELGEEPEQSCLGKALAWLLRREITALGDWIVRRPSLKPSGWAFQYWNSHYPDVDDTAVVVMAMDRAGYSRCRGAIRRATEWVLGMQSENGGWGAFEPENTHNHLNYIPFADHGALLDPPTVDVTARCIAMLAQLGFGREHPAIAKGLEFLKREQEEDGSWYGRWGVNYVYGTWSALTALAAAGEDRQLPCIRRGVAWLLSRQNDDGGWGEDCATYWTERRRDSKGSTPSQTAWALLGLMAAGEAADPAVARGVAYLLRHARQGARWNESFWTGVGFPRVFYLKYHGYAAYFPLWALARYRRLMRANEAPALRGI